MLHLANHKAHEQWQVGWADQHLILTTLQLLCHSVPKAICCATLTSDWWPTNAKPSDNAPEITQWNISLGGAHFAWTHPKNVPKTSSIQKVVHPRQALKGYFITSQIWFDALHSFCFTAQGHCIGCVCVIVSVHAPRTAASLGFCPNVLKWRQAADACMNHLMHSVALQHRHFRKATSSQ